MNLNALRLFVAVVQDGSLSRASEKLNVPIATISRQIAELEKSLNIQLFDRFKSGVKPTIAGQRLYEQVYLSIDNLVNAAQVLNEEQAELKGILRVSAPPNCTPVLEWIAEFQSQFPHIQIHCSLTDNLLDMTADGIDVAFRMGELHGDQFIAKKVLDVRTKWVAHPDLLARLGTPKAAQDLANFPLAGWARKGEKTLPINMGKKILNLPYLFASNESFAVEFMAKQGKAVCLLADYTVEHLAQTDGLVPILSDYDSQKFALTMLYAAHRYPSSVVRAFVEFVVDKVNN